MNEQDVSELLKRALAAVDSAALPEALRSDAFSSAVQLLARAEAPSSLGGGLRPRSVGNSAGPMSSGVELLDRIAAGLGVDLGSIGNLFAEDDGVPVLILQSTKLPKTKAAAAHDIALLVMAARQLSGVDDYTEPDVLRDAVKRYGRFDVSNFGKHMADLDNLVLTSGQRSATKRKLTKPGIEAAAELAKSYLASNGS